MSRFNLISPDGAQRPHAAAVVTGRGGQLGERLTALGRPKVSLLLPKMLPAIVTNLNYREMNDLSKDAAIHYAVDEAGAGQRVDNFLRRILKGVPKSHIYRILRSGEVRLNRKRVRPDARLAVGDDLRIPPVRTAVPAEPLRRRAAPPVALPILYEDEALIAVDKPSGLAVHGGSGVSFGLIERLRAARPKARFLELAHRLDRETSGVLLVAKTRAALLALHATLREGRADKRYLVLVKGRWRDAKRSVELPLAKFVTRSGQRQVRVDAGGRVARTIFHRRNVWPDATPPVSLLEADLATGRTHQIRVHLAHLGFPLAGDDRYGDYAWNRELARLGMKRMFLHAWRLSLPHPTESRALSLESPLPPDLARFVARLEDAHPDPAHRVDG